MRRAPLAVAALLTMLAATPSLAAWSISPNANLPVRVAVGSAGTPVMLSDGAGGAYLAWTDDRLVSSGIDIYLDHILKSGVMDPAWPPNGLAVCAATGDQYNPVLVADNSGGVIVVWEDHRNVTSDIYAARVNSNGTLATGWTTAGGKQIGAATPSGLARDETYPVACSDGAGGVVVAWTLVFTLYADDDIYGVRILANGTVAPGWVALGTVINGPSDFQDSPAIAPDGLGGAIVAYVDHFVSGVLQIRYRTVSASGFVGVPGSDAVSSTGIGQMALIGTSDGMNGILLAWSDQRVGPAGVCVGGITPSGLGASPFNFSPYVFRDPSEICWPQQIIPDGTGGIYLTYRVMSGSLNVQVCRLNNNGVLPSGWSTLGATIGKRIAGIAPDGTGGVMAAFSEGYDIYAMRYLSNGAPATGWYSPPYYLCNAINGQEQPAACSDGANGLIAAWPDYRDSYRGLSGIYAQRVDRFGALGEAGPSIAGAKDTPDDQGGHLRLSWNPSYLDVEPTRGVNNYYVFRQLPTHLAVQQLKSGQAKLAPEDSDQHGAGVLRATRTATTTYYWEQIATVPALALPGYSLLVATSNDSVPGSNPYTLFMVEATASSGAYWMSPPDSGYSVDNLPPLPPAPVAAAYSPGGTSFHWGPNTEGDLANYRIYRGSSLSFVPSIGNRIASPTDTTYYDATSSTYIYKMSSVDAHGNESAFTTITPTGVLAVLGTVPRELAFAIASRNPAPGNVTFKLTLPEESSVRVALYDPLGRRVRTLASGTQPAGEQTLRWDGTDDGGRAVSSGLYFARFDGAGHTLVRRLVIER